MISLVRHTTGGQGTWGVLLRDNIPLCDTIELPWKNNQPKISCIPQGTYNTTPYNSPSKGYEVWKLLSVPGREFIEMHVANFADELKGCIAPGQGYIKNGLRTGVGSSKITFDYLKSILPKAFPLTIINAFGERNV